jgi:hypothetical protein
MTDIAPGESDAKAVASAERAVTFLCELIGTGRLAVAAIVPDGRIEGETFELPAESEALRIWVAPRLGCENLYFTLNEPKPRVLQQGKAGRLRKDDVERIRGVAIDIDLRKSELALPGGLERERERLLKLAEEQQDALWGAPTLIINSGGGIQMFWLFREPIENTPEARRTVEEQGRSLGRLFGSDAVQSIEHLFRIPYTLNLPDKKKRVLGRVMRASTIIHFDPSVRYDLDELNVGAPTEERAAQQPAYSANIDLDAVYDAVDNVEALSPSQRTVAEKISSTRTLQNVDRSERDFAIAAACMRAGLEGDTDIGAVIVALSPQKFEEKDEQGRGLDYLSRTIASAKARARVDVERWFDVLPSDPTADNDDWGAPVDMFADNPHTSAVELARGALPRVIEDWAFDTAERMGVPLMFTAGSTLAVVSAAIGSKLRIQPKEHDTTWTEPAFLWLLLAEEPGGMKSPVIGQATAPLAELDKKHGMNDLVARHAWERLAAKSRRRDGPDIGPKPKIRRYVVDSFTREALVPILSDNPSGILMAADAWIGASDAYKSNKGSDRPVMLRLFDGRSFRNDRVTTGMVIVDCWGASVLGGVQPKKILEMADDLEADGLLQRFLPILADDRPRPAVDRLPDQAALAAYNETVTAIAQMPSLADNPVRLSPAAQAVRRSFESRISALCNLPDISDGWRGHLGKWRGIFARILLIFHVLDRWPEHAGDAFAGEVSADTATRAAKFGEALLSHALRFYETCVGVGQTGEDARWIAGHILSRGLQEKITRRDITDARTPWRKEPGRVAAAMRLLEGLEWVRSDLSERSDRFGASRWRISPHVFERFSERAQAEKVRREEIRARIAAAGEERSRLLRNGAR